MKIDEPIISTGWDDDDDDCSRLHKEWDWDNNPPPSPHTIMPIAMFHPLQEYFPPFVSFDKEQYNHSWIIKNPTSRNSDGLVDQISIAEAF